MMKRLFATLVLSLLLALPVFGQDCQRSNVGSEEAMIERLESYLSDPYVLSMAVTGWYQENSYMARREPVSALLPRVKPTIQAIKEGSNFRSYRPLVTKLELHRKYYCDVFGADAEPAGVVGLLLDLEERITEVEQQLADTMRTSQ